MTKTCFNCGKETTNNLYNYPICDFCKSKLKLFSDKTIKKYYLKDPKKFSKEIDRRLDFIEKEFEEINPEINIQNLCANNSKRAIKIIEKNLSKVSWNMLSQNNEALDLLEKWDF
jgi:hypothetical protein